MNAKRLLVIDAIINFILGILLLLTILFAEQLTEILGVPKIEHAFYPSIMGAVFIGIGIALLIESTRNKPQQPIGLGLGGAIAINFCGGFLLIGWLIFGDLNLPIQGTILLWLIAVILVGISSAEWLLDPRKRI